jgi:hypothetical protein
MNSAERSARLTDSSKVGVHKLRTLVTVLPKDAQPAAGTSSRSSGFEVCRCSDFELLYSTRAYLGAGSRSLAIAITAHIGIDRADGRSG